MPTPITITAVARWDRQKKDGTIPIKIRITYQRKNKELPTSLFATKVQLTKDHRIKNQALLDAIDDLVRPLRDAVAKIDPYALEGRDVHYIASVIERIMSGGAKNFTLDFPTYFEKIASEKDKYGKASFMSVLRSLSDFIGADRFDISAISSSMLRKYERYLIDKYGANARAVSMYPQTIAYVHKRAREEYNSEELDEVYIRNPFEYYKCPRQKPAAHRNIDADVIRKMLEMREGLTGRERLGVDVFLISFALMGMNVPDIYSCLKPKNNILVYQRTKTKKHRDDGAWMHVRIEPCVKKLLDEYKGSGKYAFNFRERYCNYKNLERAENIGLKAFEERLKAEKINTEKIRNYSARHSFATIAYSVGIEETLINDCLCHVDRSLAVTDIYINKDWSVLWDANAKVVALFDWPR